MFSNARECMITLSVLCYLWCIITLFAWSKRLKTCTYTYLTEFSVYVNLLTRFFVYQIRRHPLFFLLFWNLNNQTVMELLGTPPYFATPKMYPNRNCRDRHSRVCIHLKNITTNHVLRTIFTGQTP